MEAGGAPGTQQEGLYKRPQVGNSDEAGGLNMEENQFNKLLKAGLVMDLLNLVVTGDFMVAL